MAKGKGMRRCIIAMALVPQVGLAQNTICYRYGNITRCEQQGAGGVDPNTLMSLSGGGAAAGDAFASSYQAAKEAKLRQQQIEMEAQRQRQVVADEAKARERAENATTAAPVSLFSRGQLIKDVATLVARGKCDLAERSLRDMGETDLLTRTIEACLATTPPPSH